MFLFCFFCFFFRTRLWIIWEGPLVSIPKSSIKPRLRTCPISGGGNMRFCPAARVCGVLRFCCAAFGFLPMSVSRTRRPRLPRGRGFAGGNGPTSVIPIQCLRDPFSIGEVPWSYQFKRAGSMVSPLKKGPFRGEVPWCHHPKGSFPQAISILGLGQFPGRSTFLRRSPRSATRQGQGGRGSGGAAGAWEPIPQEAGGGD